MAQFHQCQLSGCRHRCHHRRIPGRQVRAQVHLHLQPARVYAGRVARHVLGQFPHAPGGIPRHGHLGRRRCASLVDLYLREFGST